MNPETQNQATNDVVEEEEKPGHPRSFTVKAETTLTAYTSKDDWEEGGKIVIGFIPNINLPHQPQHSVNEDLIRVEARRVALEMASELTGLPVNNLTVHPHEGVGAITIIKKSKKLPAQGK